MGMLDALCCDANYSVMDLAWILADGCAMGTDTSIGAPWAISMMTVRWIEFIVIYVCRILKFSTSCILHKTALRQIGRAHV